MLFVLPMAMLAGCNSTSGTNTALSSVKKTDNSSPNIDGNLRVVDHLPPPQNTREGADQLISASDILEIDVFQVDELDRTVRVDSNGRISMPLIGVVQAAGKTIPAVELELENKYGVKYLQSPDITIYMKESAGQRLTMDGQFSKPGIYATNSNTTLLQAVAVAGGLSKIADERKIFIFRQIGAQKLVANFSLKEIRDGKKADPRLFGGDVVVAFTSSSKVALQNLGRALGIATSATRLLSPL